MEKKGKKKIIIIVLIVLLLLVLMIISCIPKEKEFSPDIPEEDLNIPDQDQADTTEQPEAKTSYKKSDKLTEITFSRDVVLDDRTQNAVFTITGYLEEINPESDDLTRYYDKAHNFYDGKLEWTISSTNQQGSGDCVYTYTITGDGKDAITSLDIPYEQNEGKDESGNLIHLKPWGNLKLGYKTQGITGKSELQLLGSVLIPYDFETSIDVTDPSPNIHANCGGATEDTSFTEKDTSNSAFPLVWYGASPISQSGQASLKEMNYENSGDVQLRMAPILVTDITVLPIDGPWQVSWKIEMP